MKRAKTPFARSKPCKCGENDPDQFYATSAWCKRCHKQAVHESRLRKQGITPQELAHMANAQGNQCATCKRHESLFNRSLHADHNHETGKARGLLCGRCNQVLGRAGDDVALLRALADYLEK